MLHVMYKAFQMPIGARARLLYCQRKVHHDALQTKDVKRCVIRKLLIANRGEIACRVMRTAKKMGIQTVAVFSEVDRYGMHVGMADEAYCIGPAASQQSYLKMENIMDIAKRSGAQAIHPGYGFLSENVEFAELCASQQVIFVGPPSSAIRDMGIKSTSKRIMSSANVPIIEGYHGEEQSDNRLLEEAEKIGFPIMIKAVRGGGGKGMRIAMTKQAFHEQLSAARREAMSSFADDVMLIEKYIDRPRHVEVQIFGDHHGNAVHLFERDCSVQRRHQKVIEESPAPGITNDTRHRLGEAAVRAAKAVGYVGAGTVEFVMDPRQNFFFMEMNTRLQVEHPVSEMVTGTDLVEWQLRVAQGETVPLAQSDIHLNGHSFEARIYAEDPDNDFMPGAGPLYHLSAPPESPRVRVETGVEEGDEVSPYYDPMIAKLVVWGTDRTTALKELGRNLSQYCIVGPDTNVNFLQRLASNTHFIEGDVHTGFIEQHHDELFPAKERVISPDLACQAAFAYLMTEELENGAFDKPYLALKDFRVNLPASRDITFNIYDNDVIVNVTRARDSSGAERRFQMIVRDSNGNETEREVIGRVDVNPVNAATITEIIINGVTQRHKVVFVPGQSRDHHMVPDSFHLFPTTDDPSVKVTVPVPSFYGKIDSGSSTADQPIAPMAGKVEKVMVSSGEAVAEGQALVMMIAMKMEHTIRAPRDGVVESVMFHEGDQADKGALLVKLKELASDSN